jgi:hypothetical protein
MTGPDTDHLGSIRARLTELEAERGALIKSLHRLLVEDIDRLASEVKEMKALTPVTRRRIGFVLDEE